jgi:hypothetical protein
MPTLQWRAPLRTTLPLHLSCLLQQYSRYWQLVSTADMHLSACRARSIVPVPACLYPTQPKAACHVQMPAIDSDKMTFLERPEYA